MVSMLMILQLLYQVYGLDPLGGSMNGYYKYSELLSVLSEISSEKLEITLGILSELTFHDRPIPFVKLSSSEGLLEYQKKNILISAGLHVGNPISTSAVLQALEYFLSHPQLSEYINAYFIPIINVDSYLVLETVHSLYGKFPIFIKNKRIPTCPEIKFSGVNLDRNFDIHWERNNESHYKDGCDAEYGGPTPFSEPETQGLDMFVKEIKPQTWLHFDLRSGNIYVPSLIKTEQAKLFYEKLGNYFKSVEIEKQNGNLLEYAAYKDIYAATADISNLNEANSLIEYFYNNTHYRTALRMKGAEEFKCRICTDSESDTYIEFNFIIENHSPVESPLLMLRFQTGFLDASDYSLAVHKAYSTTKGIYIHELNLRKGFRNTVDAVIISGGYSKDEISFIVERKINNGTEVAEVFGTLTMFPYSLIVAKDFLQESSQSIIVSDLIPNENKPSDNTVFIFSVLVCSIMILVTFSTVILCFCGDEEDLLKELELAKIE